MSSPRRFLRKAALRHPLCALVLPLLAFARSNIRPQITQQIDESLPTRLVGITHPLARPQFNRGAAPLGLPMERMLLVLKCAPEEDAALQIIQTGDYL